MKTGFKPDKNTTDKNLITMLEPIYARKYHEDSYSGKLERGYVNPKLHLPKSIISRALNGRIISDEFSLSVRKFLGKYRIEGDPSIVEPCSELLQEMGYKNAKPKRQIISDWIYGWVEAFDAWGG
ncbi:hypothetical protein HN924_01990 [Candidatus Woesearchaeota archaeon]|jgi:hypothetical protein|nr:hypothetical protein [Candidatus Woesearchaeota archaeon]MBT7062716.1 hypothetical protein [Candidatus Woesearchaeota archaeon]MBT7402860.1 hypothetical protein [Candidatus Woesearchaeota archaeon]